MSLFDIITFLISFGIVFLGVIFTFKHYLSLNSRIEDFYFLMASLCVCTYYIGGLIIYGMGEMTLNIGMFSHYHLLWGYWFFTLFLFQIAPVGNLIGRRIIHVILAFLAVFGTAFSAGFSNPHFLRQEIVQGAFSLAMQMDYSLDTLFVMSIQIVKLTIISFGILFAWNLEKGLSWFFFAICFLFMNEFCSFLNLSLHTEQPVVLYFKIAQIMSILSCSFTFMGIREHFCKRKSRI